MRETDDSVLLEQFAASRSEEAFAALVTRHVNLVYSVALRHVGNPHNAEEITQAVFVILARKAKELRHARALSSWLFQATRLTATNFVRSETRRHHREEEAHVQSILNESGSELWPKIAPVLDDAVAGLREKDRQAIVLRFYEGRNLREVGLALGASEEAAEKRVNRALDKLRKFFAKRGVVSTSAIIAGTLAANSVQAAPAALVNIITVAGAAKGAAVSGSTLTLIQGALKIMAWTKAKMAVVVGAGVLFTAGTATVAAKKLEAYHTYRDSWRKPGINSEIVARAMPQVRILPAKFPPSQGGLSATVDSLKWGGLGVRADAIVWAAYSWRPGRILFPDGLPPERYDFISTLPQGSAQALQRELREELGLVGRRETRDMDVLVLKVRRPNAPGLKPPIEGSGDDWSGIGRYFCGDRPLSTDLPAPAQGLTKFLEAYFRVPVIDQTGITKRFNIDLKWNEAGARDPNHDAVKKAMLDQLGLELAPGREPVEMLVVEKVKN